MATYRVRSNDREHTVTVVENPTGGATVTVEGQTFEVEPVSDRASRVPPRPQPPASSTASARSASPRPASRPSAPAADGAIVAPISGKVLSIRVKVGDPVEADQVVLILEAMKMENNIHAPRSGTVREVAVSEGTEVGDGALLMVIE
jgi:biotin carboxyl carrier protein